MVVVDAVDGSLLFVVVVVVVGFSKKGGVVTKGVVVVLAKLVVVGLVVVVDTNIVLDESKVVVVSDGTSVVDEPIVVVGQCWWGLLTEWHWSCLTWPGGSLGGMAIAGNSRARSITTVAASSHRLVNRSQRVKTH